MVLGEARLLPRLVPLALWLTGWHTSHVIMVMIVRMTCLWLLAVGYWLLWQVAGINALMYSLIAMFMMGILNLYPDPYEQAIRGLQIVGVIVCGTLVRHKLCHVVME